VTDPAWPRRTRRWWAGEPLRRKRKGRASGAVPAPERGAHRAPSPASAERLSGAILPRVEHSRGGLLRVGAPGVGRGRGSGAAAAGTGPDSAALRRASSSRRRGSSPAPPRQCAWRPPERSRQADAEAELAAAAVPIRCRGWSRHGAGPRPGGGWGPDAGREDHSRRVHRLAGDHRQAAARSDPIPEAAAEGPVQGIRPVVARAARDPVAGGLAVRDLAADCGGSLREAGAPPRASELRRINKTCWWADFERRTARRRSSSHLRQGAGRSGCRQASGSIAVFRRAVRAASLARPGFNDLSRPGRERPCRTGRAGRRGGPGGRRRGRSRRSGRCAVNAA